MIKLKYEILQAEGSYRKNGEFGDNVLTLKVTILWAYRN